MKAEYGYGYIAEHKKVNKMGVSNISIVFGPTLFRSQTRVGNISNASALVMTLLENYDTFFGGDD